ncbi:Protein crooked neck, partial [Operophtera brumata]
MDAKPTKMPKVAKVKNKAPAEIQITAEQLLREAKERDLEILPPPPKQKISDPEELREYQHRKRKAFEDNIRKNRMKQVQRARSIYERALDVDHRNITLWLKYTELEMRNRQVNHARNLWDRAVTILPRVSQFWYKYTYMEEMLENVAGTRQVTITLIYNNRQVNHARNLWDRAVTILPRVSQFWYKYTYMEERLENVAGTRQVTITLIYNNRQVNHARNLWDRAVTILPRVSQFWYKYTYMEERLENVAGTRQATITLIYNNRQVNHARILWDRAVTILPRVSQFWYKYTYMEERLENVAGTRQVFERWMEWQPDEQAWQTYINFELRYKELDRGRQIYERFVMVHPDVKNWIKYAKFEENHGFINGSRKVFERAVEFFGDEDLDERLFIAFAKFEENQKEHDRARVIY